MTKPVIFEHDELSGVARITFNRPQVLNALDVPMAEAFRDAVTAAANASGVRAILLQAEGRAFVAGGDVSAFGSEPSRSAEVIDSLLHALHPALLRLREQDAPVIAAVRGVAAGAGFSLVLNADLVVAEEGARFVIAYDRIGASPDCGGTWFLPRKVGSALAAELMLLGGTLTTEEAKAVGIVNRVALPGELEKTADALAVQVAAGATRAFGHFRRLTDAALERPLREQLEAERAAFVAATETADFREGVAAFLAKRPPKFSGR